MEALKPPVAISKKSLELLNRTQQIMKTNMPVLFHGPIGTGKDYWAKWLAKERDPEKEFVTVASSHLDDESLWNLLHSRDNAVLYFEGLDRIKAKDNQNILKLVKNAPANVSFIFASRLSAEEMLRQGNLSPETFQTCLPLRLAIPELKERKEDIPILVSEFCGALSTKYSKKKLAPEPALADFFIEYDYPGNVSQLKSLLETLAVYSSGTLLQKKYLPKDFFASSYLLDADQLEVRIGVTMRDYEREIIRKNLEAFNGNRAKTAETLGISERTIYRKIIEYELNGSPEADFATP